MGESPISIVQQWKENRKGMGTQSCTLASCDSAGTQEPLWQLCSVVALLMTALYFCSTGATTSTTIKQMSMTMCICLCCFSMGSTSCRADTAAPLQWLRSKANHIPCQGPYHAVRFVGCSTGVTVNRAMRHGLIPCLSSPLQLADIHAAESVFAGIISIGTHKEGTLEHVVSGLASTPECKTSWNRRLARHSRHPDEAPAI